MKEEQTLIKQKTYLIVTFFTTAGAMAMEAHAATAGIPGKLISAPRKLSSDCGIAFRTDPEQKELLETMIHKDELEIEAIHLLEM